MHIQSVMIVPLAARKRTLGALTIISAESGRRYEADDLEVANILGRRAALALDNARMYELEQQARAQSEEAQRRAELLAEATTQLSASLDYPTTLSNVSRLIVPTYADFCIVLLSDGQRLRQVAAAHRDEQQQRLLDELPKHYETTLTNPLSLASTVWRTGDAMLLRELPAPARAEVARSGDAARIVAALAAQSSIIVPLNTSVRTLGVISFSYAESGRQYREADMPFAKELAACAALAIEHARLFKEAQTLNAELEQRVAERTAQLQRANEDLRNLAAHLQTTREQERTNLARELHDELGQILTVIKIEATQLSKRVAQVLEALNYPPEQLLEPLHLIQANVDEGVRAVRQIITQMRPEFLEDLGLKAAIEWQLQQFQSRTGIETQFSSNVEQLQWDQERATAMFRILQESLTNVARHAEATRVDVSLRREPEYLLLEVHDNGRGISNTEMHKSSHFGIMGMRERAILLGGEIQIAGAQGGGTSLLVRVPH
ncbi:MAG: GAF domain-containing sensor histidine kinase [Chloroflexi bacterium]|nr:MAG: GAF domain-containing sensor histidine kinase [Chloroflexota bacterium]